MNKKGFTLIEIIVVMAILAILAGIAVPLAFGAIDNSKKTVCVANRTTVRRIIPQEEALRGKPYTIDEIKAYITTNKIICPKEGVISVRRLVKMAGMDGIKIACSVHVEVGDVSRGELVDFTQFIADNGAIGSNDALREAFLKANDGKWPTMTVDGKVYYIQPFYQAKGSSSLPLDEKVWLYATEDAGSNNNWFVPFIFDPATEKWYQARTYDGTAQGGANIETPKNTNDLQKWVNEATHSSGKKIWQEIKDYKEDKQKIKEVE